MGKWADALAAHLAHAAHENSRHPPTEAPSKPSKAPFEPFEGEGVGGVRRISGAANDPAPAHPAPARPPAGVDTRPYRLAQAEADAAHAQPWDDAAIGLFVARVSLFLRRGISASDADDLAERLHLRDVQKDVRRLCLECAHLSGRAGPGGAWRCGSHRTAEVGHDALGELATWLQRCPAFQSSR